MKKNEKIYNILLLIIILTILLQLIVTYLYTNTKKFSVRALIRNLSITITIYFSYKYKNISLLFFPIIIEILLEYLKFNGYYIDKYIATEYQYNDYWRNMNKNAPQFSNFSEANYDKMLGLDTKLHNNENLKKILEWGEKTYNKSIKNDIKPDLLIDVNGNKHDREELKKESDDEKFKLICNKLNLNSNMRVLEIGFGETDFLQYLRNNYNINPVGVSISSEQVELAKGKGFEAYTMDFWNMNKKKLGMFDVIIQCGNVEYVMCTGDSEKKYYEYFEIINSLLIKNGKYFITCIHFNENFPEYTLYDNINAYWLWSGNDGCYPSTTKTLINYAEKAGLKSVYQEERTNDYHIASIIFMSYLQCIKDKCINSYSLHGIFEALIKTIAGPYYLHTYICYTPSNSMYWLPWNWQFIPQEKNGVMISPVTLQYICFQK